jgi:hypothetical protein
MYKYNIKSKWIGKTITIKMAAAKKVTTHNMIRITNKKTKKE